MPPALTVPKQGASLKPGIPCCLSENLSEPAGQSTCGFEPASQTELSLEALSLYQFLKGMREKSPTSLLSPLTSSPAKQFFWGNLLPWIHGETRCWFPDAASRGLFGGLWYGYKLCCLKWACFPQTHPFVLMSSNAQFQERPLPDIPGEGLVFDFLKMF